MKLGLFQYEPHLRHCKAGQAPVPYITPFNSNINGILKKCLQNETEQGPDLTDVAHM